LLLQNWLEQRPLSLTDLTNSIDFRSVASGALHCFLLRGNELCHDIVFVPTDGTCLSNNRFPVNIVNHCAPFALPLVLSDLDYFLNLDLLNLFHLFVLVFFKRPAAPLISRNRLMILVCIRC
jgi:hypothetical protein